LEDVAKAFFPLTYNSELSMFLATVWIIFTRILNLILAS